MDIIGSGVLAACPGSALAYLCSPTDVFAIPQSARDRSMAAFDAAENSNGGGSVSSRLHHLVRFLRTGALAPNVACSSLMEPRLGQSPSKLPIVDSLVVQQGPNYCFAKRLQHWRAMVARHDGHVVSSNVAPASNTHSVLKNQLLAAAFQGADLVKPLLIFEPETSNVLMTFLLLHDLANEKGNPETTNHPLMLFSTTAVHNGVWTCAYQLRSVLELVVIAEYIKRYSAHLRIAGTCGVAVVAAAVAAWRTGATFPSPLARL